MPDGCNDRAAGNDDWRGQVTGEPPAAGWRGVTDDDQPKPETLTDFLRSLDLCEEMKGRYLLWKYGPCPQPDLDPTQDPRRLGPQI